MCVQSAQHRRGFCTWQLLPAGIQGPRPGLAGAEAEAEEASSWQEESSGGKERPWEIPQRSSARNLALLPPRGSGIQ